MSQAQSDDLVSDEVVHGCLETVITDLGIKNYTIDVAPGSRRGDNYLGIIAKVQVQGVDKDNKKVTLSFIVKSAPRSGLIRKFTPIRKAFEREIYVYNKVLAEFTKLQEERGILNPFKSFAKYYGSIMDDMNEAFVLEDMKEIGFELQDRHQPLDFNHVLLVLKEYGKLHALSYALRDQKPELFRELSKNTEDEFFCEMLESMRKMGDDAKRQTQTALKALDPIKDQDAYEKFQLFEENMFDLVQKIVRSETAGKYAVIGHGDCWINNMLFKYDQNTSNPKVPSRVCLLDWQVSRLGSPVLDLSYFIFTCTDKQLRDQYYDHLIKEYYKSFCLHSRQLGCDPEKVFPFAVLQSHLREFSVYGLYMAVMALFFMVSETEEIPDIHKMQDIKEATSFKHELKNVDKYYSRVRGVILDFVRLGYNF